jgi:hypothetical protein
MQAGRVRSLRREPCHAHIRSPTLRNGGRRRQRWCSRIEPLGSTVARSLPGTLDLSNNPIFRSIVLLFVFGVFIPVTLAAIYVTSAVNVVLDALGLPLLPNVPDPPFGPATPLATANTTPTAESNPVVPQTNKLAASTGDVEDNPVLSDPAVRRASELALSAGSVDKHAALSDLVPQMDQTVRPTAGVEIDAPSSDVVEQQPDITSATKPSSDTVKQSPRFTPKRRVRANSSQVPNDASTEDQHPVGDSGLKLRKPKADKANGEQTHDQSSKQGPK